MAVAEPGTEVPRLYQKPRWSPVWLSGALCSPTRLPLALFLSTCQRVKVAIKWLSSPHRIRMTMTPTKGDLIILALASGSVLVIYTVLSLLTLVLGDDGASSHWIVSLAFNLLGYGTVFVPGYLIIRYVKRTGSSATSQTLCLSSLLRLCIFGTEETIGDSIQADQKAAASSSKQQKTEIQKGGTLLFCFLGLQASYLTWGVLQEKIMTRTYQDSVGNEGRFKDSQFLVFVNRILAFGIALLSITWTHQPRHRAPLYKYSFCSFSNIMSSWCQYEALKFVSFPTQVLAKASKIIPVMIMGKIVSRNKYETYEYVVAVLISFGMMLFLFGSQEDSGQEDTRTTTLSGLVLLLGYMTSDSFTSNWQNELFTTYKMSSMQMMAGVNLFSCMLTLASLLQQGTLYASLIFMSQFPKFTFDCIILSICSAVGQLFIYYTISQFGAVVFIIMMTLRQAMAVILSCIIYDHEISAGGVFGVIIVFGAMFLKIYCGQRLKRLRAQQAKTTTATAIEKPDPEQRPLKV